MTLRFLAGGGTMGERMRSHDWSASPLGPPDAWPPQLKTLVGIMLAAPQAMFAAWGDERCLLYNDAYREMLGDHHPALDRPMAQVWTEVMHVLDPILARAYAGEPTWMDDIELVLQRHGHIRRVDVQRLLASMEDLFVRTLGSRVALTVEASADLWSARIDAGQLENALLNLVINASHAMPDGGELAVSAGDAQIDAAFASAHAELKPGDYVLLSVRDTGAGMPASVIARAFEPFFTTKPLGQGTGLGLSMVYGFVKQAGGHVAIASAPGRGTTVRLYLPRDASGFVA